MEQKWPPLLTLIVSTQWQRGKYVQVFTRSKTWLNNSTRAYKSSIFRLFIVHPYFSGFRHKIHRLAQPRTTKTCAPGTASVCVLVHFTRTVSIPP